MPVSLVLKHPMEVCPFSRGVMLSQPVSLALNSCPSDYRRAFAFSIAPYPPALQPCLRSACPIWFLPPEQPCSGDIPVEASDGLTMFHSIDRFGLGSLCPPVAWSACKCSQVQSIFSAHPVPMTGEATAPVPATLPFWLKPLSSRLCTSPMLNSILWLVHLHDVYREFAFANHADHPCPSLPDAGCCTFASRFRCPAFAGGIRCPRAPYRRLPRRKSS